VSASARGAEAPVGLGSGPRPDAEQVDESTLGGYIAVHARPPAFGGADGNSYTVEMLTDTTDEPADPVGGYLLFVSWGTTDAPTIRGHVESEFLVRGRSEAEVRAALGRLSLFDVKRTLDRLLGGHDG
jgi:hypothetical protein